MNTYLIQNGADAPAFMPPNDYLAAVTIGQMLSANFDVLLRIDDPTTAAIPTSDFAFALPFALTNLGIDPIGYDTRFQGVKEFLDKPYAVAGFLVSLIQNPLAPSAYDVKSDMDNFISYPIVLNEGGGTFTPCILYIGKCNGTLTESYAPFAKTASTIGAGIKAIKFWNPQDFALANLQDIATAVINNTAGSVIPVGGGILTSPSSPIGGAGVPATLNSNRQPKRWMMTSKGLVYQ